MSVDIKQCEMVSFFHPSEEITFCKTYEWIEAKIKSEESFHCPKCNTLMIYLPSILTVFAFCPKCNRYFAQAGEKIK